MGSERESYTVKGIVWFVERNIRGAWVVYGIDGIKQYYGYSKAAAVRRYKADCRVVVNQRR